MKSIEAPPVGPVPNPGSCFGPRCYLDHDDAGAVFAKLGVPPVAVSEQGDCFQHAQESLLTLAEGKDPGTNNERKGLVVRPRREAFSSALNGRLSFKVIGNRCLRRAGEWPDGGRIPRAGEVFPRASRQHGAALVRPAETPRLTA